MEIIRSGIIDTFSVEGPDGGACSNCLLNSCTAYNSCAGQCVINWSFK